MLQIILKLIQNSRFNSDVIIYLVKLIINLDVLYVKLNELNINFEIGVFNDVRNEARPLHFDVACFDCD